MVWSKKVRRLMKQLSKDTIERKSRGCETERNAQVREMLDRVVVDGKYGVIIVGRDCDCTAYSRSRVLDAPKSVADFKRYWDEHCEWLDGPESQSFCRPDEVDTSGDYSRDLVLEAYEDGRPHSIRF